MHFVANADVLKEPRGFIKFLEIVLAICAFATAVGPSISTSFRCMCPSAEYSDQQLLFSYPYKLEDETFQWLLCLDTTNDTTTAIQTVQHLSGNCQSASEFFVFVGVVVFLFSLAALLFYVFLHEQYHGVGIISKIDFIITVIFTVLWLISSSAFADAVAKIKHYTDPEWLWKSDESTFTGYSTGHNITCTGTQYGNYATLNSSVIFGFLNMVVWFGNNWFLYKETDWFGKHLQPPVPQQQVPSSTSDAQGKV